MKITKLLLLMGISSLSMSFTSKNDSFISLNGFELEINEVKKTVRLMTRITTNGDYPNADCYFDWNIYKDGRKINLEHIRTVGFRKVTNSCISTAPEFNIEALGKDNYIEVVLTPSDMGGNTISKRLYFNYRGEKEVKFQEKDNNIGVTSGFHMESYSEYDYRMNFILEDRITFTNFEDLLVEDVYNNFDIDKFEYTYTGNYRKKELEGDFKFCIYDKYNLFKDLPLYKNSQYRYVPLKAINKSGSLKGFTYDGSLFFDPETHNPSLKYKEGYRETNKLYFPKGQLNNLKSLHCLLTLDINGYTKFNLSGEFNIYFLKNYFGECEDSEYCVEMNNDDGHNIREKVVDIDL